MPVHTQLAGYTIQLPITVAQLSQEYKQGFTSHLDKFIDSTQTTRAEWWFDDWGGKGNQKPTNQAYGVNIFLKNKADQLDSVKTALEHYYSQPLKPLVITKLNTKGSYPGVYTCLIDGHNLLVLKKATQYEPWSQYNCIRISVGYNLNTRQQELFAILDGRIEEDKY